MIWASVKRVFRTVVSDVALHRDPSLWWTGFLGLPHLENPTAPASNPSRSDASGSSVIKTVWSQTIVDRLRV